MKRTLLSILFSAAVGFAGPEDELAGFPDEPVHYHSEMGAVSKELYRRRRQWDIPMYHLSLGIEYENASVEIEGFQRFDTASVDEFRLSSTYQIADGASRWTLGHLWDSFPNNHQRDSQEFFAAYRQGADGIPEITVSYDTSHGWFTGISIGTTERYGSLFLFPRCSVEGDETGIGTEVRCDVGIKLDEEVMFSAFFAGRMDSGSFLGYGGCGMDIQF
ncbi:hypothetical protein J4460_01290 [Candidatus Woesearchaeota archaeon]|nr:MAG: hypothetical protein QS99_C0001G0074 [archaeon GW2011_AR4]MBS3129286.1 hypothetical protein [Candidatus Woesearchaeota archaeon]HIH38589.1 hypothetical protein [Candidatus Woesearchaeota archaeon]HIJ02793.1 hypothetical protein [Candidatus Woesearchaeota archaeon]